MILIEMAGEQITVPPISRKTTTLVKEIIHEDEDEIEQASMTAQTSRDIEASATR